MEERERILKNEVLRRVHAEAQKTGYRAALDAVFAPTPTPPPAAHSSARMIAPSAPKSAPKHPEQEELLDRLDDANEAHVRDALAMLDRLLLTQPPKRRTLADARLRRLESSAEEEATRALAAKVRRRLSGATLVLGA